MSASAASRRSTARTAKSVVLAVEDPQEYAAFHSRLVATFDPVPGPEHLLTEELADALWRLKRAQRIEASAFDHYLETLKFKTQPDDPAARAALRNDIGLGLVLSDEFAEPMRKLLGYLGGVERFYLRLQSQLLKLQAERRSGVQASKVVAENSGRVGPRNADPIKNSALLRKNTLHPAPREK